MTPTAANAKKSADLALATLALNAKLNMDYSQLVAQTAQFSILRKENEDDVSFMKRAANELTRVHYALRADEDAKRVDLIADGKSQPQRTGLAGFFAKASDRLASL
jgi:hypothetical protein